MLHTVIRWVAIALYRYSHRDMELWRFTGKITGIWEECKNLKKIMNLRRGLCSLIVPQKVVSSCDKRKQCKKAVAVIDKKKQNLSVGLEVLHYFLLQGQWSETWIFWDTDFNHCALLESWIATTAAALCCRLIHDLPAVGHRHPAPPARVTQGYRAPGCPRLALMLKSAVLPTSPRCQFAAISFVWQERIAGRLRI